MKTLFSPFLVKKNQNKTKGALKEIGEKTTSERETKQIANRRPSGNSRRHNRSFRESLRGFRKEKRQILALLLLPLIIAVFAIGWICYYYGA